MTSLFSNFHEFTDYVSTFCKGLVLQNIRYFIFAGLAFLVIFYLGRKRWGHKKIWLRPLSQIQIKREIRWSILTSLVIAAIYLGIAWLSHIGFTKIYFSIEQEGWLYLLLSFIGMIVWHDTWFYWIHRFMHWKPVMHYVHRVHHLSSDPSPFAAFAFHPLETILEAGFMIIAVIVLPLHPITIILVNFFQMSMNVIGHSGHELFPKNFIHHRIFKWFNTSTHHHMHHRHSKHNFGLYFNFWDRLLKTNHPHYFDTFDQVQNRNKQSA